MKRGSYVLKHGTEVVGYMVFSKKPFSKKAGRLESLEAWML